MSPLISTLSHFASSLPSDEHPNFDIVENVLCKINADFIEVGHSAFALTRYLEWILTVSEVRRNWPYFYPKRLTDIILSKSERKWLALPEGCGSDSNLVGHSVRTSGLQ